MGNYVYVFLSWHSHSPLVSLSRWSGIISCTLSHFVLEAAGFSEVIPPRVAVCISIALRLSNFFPTFPDFFLRKNMPYTLRIRWDPMSLHTFVSSMFQYFFSTLVKTSSKSPSQCPLIILCGDAPVSSHHSPNHESHQLTVHSLRDFSMFSMKAVWQTISFV